MPWRNNQKMPRIANLDEMKSYVKLGVIVLLAACFSFETRAQNIIPEPQSIVKGKGMLASSQLEGIMSNLNGKDIALLKDYIPQSISQKLNAKKKRSVHKDSGCFLQLVCTGTPQQAQVAADSVRLQGYHLRISDHGVKIEALTPMGLFYGLQTLRQLEEKGKFPYIAITDQPKYPYRGIMIDCSRHFFPIDVLKKQLDAMAYYKFDRFHWHLVDGGGWRLEIKKYPRLTEETAYRTQEDWEKWWNNGDRTFCRKEAPGAYGGYYTQDEVRNLLAYAAARHITVIPEIEMPGHSNEVLWAYPELACGGKVHGQSDFCVGKDSTYQFLKDVLMEVMALFPSSYIHIGGDEAERKTWATCTDCQREMQANGLNTTAELQGHFTENIEQFLNSHGRKLMGWDEIMEGKLAPNAAVMSWRGFKAGLEAARKGHPVVMTPGEYCYLDMYQDAPMTQPKAQGGFVTLEKTYGYEPLPDSCRTPQTEAFVGGLQGNVWTEYISTPKHLEYMLYPRALALAEIGWTNGPKDYAKFRKRALHAVAFLQQKGYNTFDLPHEIGERKEFVSGINHDALNKRVTYLSKYAPKYRAEGDSTLTNGRGGNWGYIEGRWQGFIDPKGVEVIIDMEKVTDIKDIEINFMQQPASMIYTPASVQIGVSAGGKDYVEIDKTTCDIQPSAGYLIYPYRWKGHAKGRYVHIKAQLHEPDSWLFTDEIIINRK